MDDEELAWDPLKFILENKNENVSCYKYMCEIYVKEGNFNFDKRKSTRVCVI